MALGFAEAHAEKPTMEDPAMDFVGLRRAVGAADPWQNFPKSEKSNIGWKP